jgi:nitroreductase
MTSANGRHADHPIDPMFLQRWSPRAFTAEPIEEKDLLIMLEAARWAASSYNSQPWRFIYARRDTPHWEGFLNLLVAGNQVWAKEASALMFLISNFTMRRPGTDTEVPSRTHSLDAGTASGYFALQASRMGWSLHGMVGFDEERAPLPSSTCRKAIEWRLPTPLGKLVTLPNCRRSCRRANIQAIACR